MSPPTDQELPGGGACVPLHWSWAVFLLHTLEFHDSRAISISSPFTMSFEFQDASFLLSQQVVSPQVPLSRACTPKCGTLKGRLCLCSAPTRAAKTTQRVRFGAKSGGRSARLCSPVLGCRGRAICCRTIPRPRWSVSPWRP